MTFRQLIEKKLFERGVGKTLASQVADYVEDRIPSMVGRWHESVDSVEDEVVATIWQATRSNAIDYLNLTNPGHISIEVLKTI